MARWAIENPDSTVDLVPGRHPNSAEVASTGENPGRTAILPGFTPAALGDPTFLTTHHVRFPYICGEMANGIASVPMVIAMAKVDRKSVV